MYIYIYIYICMLVITCIIHVYPVDASTINNTFLVTIQLNSIKVCMYVCTYVPFFIIIIPI